MSFQTIFDISQSIGVQNRRTIGQQVSRSGQVRVAQYLTSVPWQFTVKPHNYLYYPQVRGVIQTIDNYDRQIPQTITFAGTGLNWFTSYQGALTLGQVSALTLASVPATNATTISVGNLPSVTSGVVIFAAGDFIQLGTLGTTRLYQVTADATPVAGGATLQIVPKLRAPSVNNEAVNIRTPGVLLRLTSPVPASIGLADIYRFSISAREAL